MRTHFSFDPDKDTPEYPHCDTGRESKGEGARSNLGGAGAVAQNPKAPAKAARLASDRPTITSGIGAYIG